MIDLSRVADNGITLLILAGFGYLMYYSAIHRGHGSGFSIKNMFRGKR